MWIAHEFVDWRNANIRGQLFDSATLTPVLPAQGVLEGIVPQIWMYGGPGDWAAGHNRGSHGLRMISTVDVARARYDSVLV